MPRRLRAVAKAGLMARWWALLFVAAQNALAATLVEDTVCALDGVTGDLPPWPELALSADFEDAGASRLPLR